jgi:hypothetical protein
MQVTCPVCWHSVVTVATCQSCGFRQCLEYEGPVCKVCGGVCRPDVKREEVPAAASGSEAA